MHSETNDNTPAAPAQRRISPPRRTKRLRKPIARIVDWESYPHEFVDFAQLALRWGEERETLRTWARAGIITAYLFGRKWKMSKADAMAFEQRAQLPRTG